MKKTLNERVEKNLNVLKLLAGGYDAVSKEEKLSILNEYTGWGGLREAIFNPSIYRELKCYLSNEKINTLKHSTKSAYYTPDFVVKFVWSMLIRLGFKEGNILEPAAGTGVFLDHIPQQVKDKSNIEAVEADLLSSHILAAKHPELNISCSGFENINYSKSKYDLIISNPPYGSQLLEDIQYRDLDHLVIHHFFVAKCARLLKDNGIIAMVLPQFFLDNVKEHARDIISADGINMLFAYRLPENIFSNAKVTVDIVFLQKRQTNVAWQKTEYIEINGYRKPINEYFVANPWNVLGKLDVVPMYGRMGITCKAVGDLRRKLEMIILNKKTVILI